MHSAVYPGSFDPITKGHLDILRRSLKLFDHVTVAIGVNMRKKGWLPPALRSSLIQGVLLTEDLSSQVSIRVFDGLTVDLCNEVGASVIIRGLRTVSDFDGEFVLGMNNMRLDEKIETIFMLPRSEHHFTSSSSFREIYSRDPERAKGLVPRIVFKNIEAMVVKNSGEPGF